MKEKKNLLISLSKLSKVYRAEVKVEMSASDFSPNELDLITFCQITKWTHPKK